MSRLPPLNAAQIHESLFIHTNWGPNYASHPTWSDWFEESGNRTHPNPSRGRRVGLSSLAMRRRGWGWAWRSGRESWRERTSRRAV